MQLSTSMTKALIEIFKYKKTSRTSSADALIKRGLVEPYRKGFRLTQEGRFRLHGQKDTCAGCGQKTFDLLLGQCEGVCSYLPDVQFPWNCRGLTPYLQTMMEKIKKLEGEVKYLEEENDDLKGRLPEKNF